MNLASAFQESALLFAASDAGVFGALSKLGEATAPAVAKELGLDERAVTLILNATVAAGLLEKHGDLFKNTPESALFLTPGTPADLSKAIIYMRDVYPAWGKLAEFVKTGKPVESPDLHLGDDAARTRGFVLSMHGRALAMAEPVLAKLPLENCRQLLDIGGGPGTYSVLLSKKYPQLRSTVLDLPAVVQIAQGLIAQQGASAAVSTLAGDYRATPFPGGNDVVLFFGMMHQESPESIQLLLQKGFAALSPGGTVYVMDLMTDASHTTPKFSAMFGLNMALTTHSGWVFSADEISGWLRGAGFVDPLVEPFAPPVPHWLAQARKPN